MFVVNWDVVITNGTNRIVIVPKASGTLNHRPTVCFLNAVMIQYDEYIQSLSSLGTCAFIYF